MIEIDLSQKQALNADPKTIKQTNFTVNLDQEGQRQCILLLKKQKKPY